MKKATAIGILTTMLLGFLSWSALAIIELKTDVVRIDAAEQSNKEILLDMRNNQRVMQHDIKLLLQKSK